jgi:hypothetical protein
MEKKNGYYYGTEIEEQFWRRYTKDGFFARGNGRYWIDNDGLFFLRYLTRKPMFIPFTAVIEVKLGNKHAGRWVPGMTVLKVIWKKDGQQLSSGFAFGRKNDDTINVLDYLRKNL